MQLPPPSRIHNKFFNWSRWLLVVLIAMSLLVLAGWLFNINSLKQPLPNTRAMNPVTAILLLLSGLAALLVTSIKQDKFSKNIGVALAVLTLLTATARLLLLLIDPGWQVDSFLFSEKLLIPGSGEKITMAANIAVSFILTSLAIIILNARTEKGIRVAQILNITTALMALLALICYIYRSQRPDHLPQLLIPLGIHAAFCLLLLSVSLLFCFSGYGIMKEITGNRAGSTNARILIPVAIVIPVILGFIRLMGHWAGSFSTEFGTSLLVFIIIFIFLVFIWYSALYTNRRDRQKEEIQKILEEREAQLQTILQSAPDAVIVINEKGNILSWNFKAEQMFGWSSREVIGHPLTETIIPEKYRLRHEQGLANYLRTGVGPVLNKTIEIEANRRDGSCFDISLSISPSKLKDQTIFISFLRDITEDKKAAANMRYNSLLLQNVSDAVISTDENMIIRSWNDAAEKMYGYKPEEIIGKNIDILQLQLSADGRKKQQSVSREYGYYKDEYTGRDKDGKEITILTSTNVINTGDRKGYVAVHRDITMRKKLEAQLRFFNKDLSKLVEEKIAEIKKSEEKYRSLIEQAADAIALFNENNMILDVNESATTLLGYSREELKGMSLIHVLSAKELKENPVSFDLLEKGEATIKPRRMIRKDGSVVETEVHAKKLSDGTFLALIRDLTERKKSEEELRQSYDAIRQLVSHLQDIREEERLRMAQEIHDELGQQLTVLKMDVSWLDQKLGDTSPQVKERTQGLKSLIDNTVKTVRRIASELRPSVLDDMGLAVAIEQHIKDLNKRTGLQIEFDMPAEEMNLPDPVKIGLFRVVQEALTNVVRYAKANLVTITLNRAGDILHLQIKDDGIGFDHSKIAVKKTLGILGMKERTAQLGGLYQIRSSPGKGTIINVTIPLQAVQSPS